MIGNPPYVRRTSISKNDKQQYGKKYKSATKQYDLYLLFIEMGMKQLSEKGHLCFINPIRFFNSDYGFGCRKFLVKNHRIRSVLDISQLPVFQNAMTYPCVMLLQQGYDSSNDIFYRRLSDLKEIQEVGKICPIITSQKEIELDSEHKFIIYVDTSLRNLIKKIDSKCHLLSEYFDIARGLANNKVNFDGSGYKALKSTNVRKYFIAGELNYIDTDFAKVFKEEMIILPRTVAYLQAMLKEKKIICLDRIYYLSPTTSINLKFILGVINANLTNLWFECYYKTTKVQGNYFDLNGNQIGSIPIPPATAEQQKPIIALVDKILAAKKANPNTNTYALEAQIDNLVYKLYSLDEEEIRIVEEKRE
ncbi:MAG: hypothetical protein HDR55_06920 [Treponema sp.]|nr:hypothetical protein [Treponema sp.]